MCDMADHAEDGGHSDHHDHEGGRTTAPQSEYTMREVGVGFAVALVSFLVVFAVPILVGL
jgi:hypothetical protein